MTSSIDLPLGTHPSASRLSMFVHLVQQRFLALGKVVDEKQVVLDRLELGGHGTDAPGKVAVGGQRAQQCGDRFREAKAHVVQGVAGVRR